MEKGATEDEMVGWHHRLMDMSLSKLQEIFPTQGLNPGLPHCRQILYQRSHQGSLSFDWFDLQFSRVLLNPKLNKYLLVTLASPLLVENRVNSQDS